MAMGKMTWGLTYSGKFNNNSYNKKVTKDEPVT